MSKNREFTIRDTNVIKGIAIILMIFHHCFMEPERYAGQIVSFYPFTEQFVNYWCRSMNICVSIFTLLSAYGITVSYKRRKENLDLTAEDIGPGVIRRLIKLLAGFIFVFLIAVIYEILVIRKGRFAYVYGKGLPSLVYFLIDLLGLAQFFHTPTYLATFWYMSLAIFTIIVIPVLIRIYKRYGAFMMLSLTVIASVLLAGTNKHTFNFFPDYLFVIGLGIIAADRNLLARAKDLRVINKPVKFLLYLVLIYVTIRIRQWGLNMSVVPVCHGAVSLLIILFGYEFLADIPGVSDALVILGKYSMNMFLAHNFIRIMWYYDFTYSFRHFLLIGAVLLVLSLILSIAIEYLKKWIHYNEGVSRLTGKVLSIAKAI